MARIVQYKSRKGQFGIQTIKQGNISDAVWKHPIMQTYLKSTGVFGYVGNSQRTLRTDRILMQEFKQAQVPSDIVAEWLTSTSGRHVMDEDTSHMSDVALREHFRKWVSHAALEVAKWRKEKISYR